jgi:mono/diheme cytochrome c family protein
MFPRPPQLLKGKGVTDDPAGETYWKVANGIRLTGMPAYKKTLSEREMWQISELLAGADKLPSEVTDVLKKPVPTEP